MGFEDLDDFAYSLNYWRLCDELNIVQAAMLVANINPSSSDGANAEGWDVHNRPDGYEAAKAAIGSALRRGLIKGNFVPAVTIRFENSFDEPLQYNANINESTVEVESLKTWLASRGFRRGFFFPDKDDAPDYLDPLNPRYAPKLAAAVRAWQAVTESGKKSPKQALEKWLRENAAAFGLVDEDGNPINQAVEDCSKVANWNQSGGAPKTPSV
jgi:hypothetical protein